MIDTDLVTYKKLYLETARDHLSNLRKNLKLLGEKPSNSQVIYEIFRLFHSLKSQNFFMGFEKTANLSKTLESYFREIKEGKRVYNPGVTNRVLDSIKKLEDSLISVEKTNLELDLTQEITNLETSIF